MDECSASRRSRRRTPPALREIADRLDLTIKLLLGTPTEADRAGKVFLLPRGVSDDVAMAMMVRPASQTCACTSLAIQAFPSTPRFTAWRPHFATAWVSQRAAAPVPAAGDAA